MTVAAVGITDQSRATVLPWVPSRVGAQDVGVLQAPRQRALCWGSPKGDPCLGQGGAPADCLLPLVLKAK